MAVAALVVSVIALAVAIASAWFTHRQADANERLARIEEERRAEERSDRAESERLLRLAVLELYAERHPDRRLFVRNVGRGTAENVMVEIVASLGGGELPQLLTSLAADRLLPGGTASAKVVSSKESARRVECRVTWTDGAEGRRDERQVVELV